MKTKGTWLTKQPIRTFHRVQAVRSHVLAYKLYDQFSLQGRLEDVRNDHYSYDLMSDDEMEDDLGNGR